MGGIRGSTTGTSKPGQKPNRNIQPERKRRVGGKKEKDTEEHK